MVVEIILYTLGICMIAKSFLVLILKKPILGWVAKLLKKKQSVNSLAILEIILGIILIALGYFVF
ncbi:MAG: hypothetical protein NTW17_03520 [Candidatus Pacearchaeota archaeon]|nr:hypothetical protein [Candidatus Pacearchaeota archaeon]